MAWPETENRGFVLDLFVACRRLEILAAASPPYDSFGGYYVVNSQYHRCSFRSRFYHLLLHTKWFKNVQFPHILHIARKDIDSKPRTPCFFVLRSQFNQYVDRVKSSVLCQRGRHGFQCFCESFDSVLLSASNFYSVLSQSLGQFCLRRPASCD